MIDLGPITGPNSSFSKALPGLQTAVDSTSLGVFKTCPRKYYYSIIMGYRLHTESVHLTFGIWMHQGVESYARLRLQGQSHDDCVAEIVHQVLKWTWNSELKRPWISDHKNKNRLTLVRTLVWYLDHHKDDPLQTITLASGRPAVELSFSFDSGFKTLTTDEPILFCGHLDRMVNLNGLPYIVDLKTTEHTISPSFFAKFTPDNQFSMYTLAGRVAFGIPVQAIIVDAAQVAVGFSTFDRHLVQRDESTVAEWQRDTRQWLEQMEYCATQEQWPMNDKSCHQYGGCEFREICSKAPGSRQLWLDKEYKRSMWDPLIRRGDI